MPIRATCEACESSFLVKDELAGKLGKCPRCGETFRVPGGAAESEGADRGDLPALDASGSSLNLQIGSASSSGIGRTTGSKSRLTPSANGKPGETAATQPASSKGKLIWAGVSLVSATLLVVAGTYVLRPAPKKQAKGTSTAQQPIVEPHGIAKIGKPSRFDDSHLPDLKKPKPGATDQEIIEYVQQAVVKIDVHEDYWNPRSSLGSGFIIDKERLLVATNFHVIRGAVKADVLFRNGVRFGVEGAMAVRPESDLAIIKLNGAPKQIAALPLRWGDNPPSDSVAFAIGHPHGYEFVVTRGRINMTSGTRQLPSKDQRWMQHRKMSEENVWIMHDARIEPGNSGGPLVNTEGEVLGINSLLVRGEQGFRNMAIHIKHLQEMLDHLNAEPVRLEQLPGEEPEKLTLDDLRESFKDAADLKWKPKDRDEYNTLAELALHWARAKLILTEQPRIFGVFHEGAPREWQAELDRILGAWQKTPWDEAQIKAVNSNGNLRGAVFTFVTVESANAGERTMAQVSLIGTGDKAIAVLPPKEKAPAKGDRLLMIGIATRARAIDQGAGKETETTLIHAAGVVPLTKSN